MTNKTQNPKEHLSKYDMVEKETPLELEKQYQELSHQLELNAIEKNKKEFENNKIKIDVWIKILQFIIVNLILIVVIIYSIAYVNKLIGIIEIDKDSNVIWILGPFTLGITLSILYVCGTTIKAVFGWSDIDKNSHILSTLEVISKVKNTTDTKN